MAALRAYAASRDDDPNEDGGSHFADDEFVQIGAPSRSGRCAPHSTCATDILIGAHNAEALEAGRALVEIAARKPARGILQILSGKAGSGKTTILRHLADLARSKSELAIVIIDLGDRGRTSATIESTLPDVGGADPIFIDNAHRAATPWWPKLARRFQDSASVLVAYTPDGMENVAEPWRMVLRRWRETEIGPFHCEFRRDLIAALSYRRSVEHRCRALSEAAVDRLADEPWKNGWQVETAVDACMAYAHIIAREPRLCEIADIARNIVMSERQKALPLPQDLCP